MSSVVIVAARRTPIAKFHGSLAGVPAHALGAQVIKGMLADVGIQPSAVDEVIVGQVLTAACGQNPARQAAVMAGLPYEVPSMTINKVCGSGLKALQLAAQAIACGDASVVVAGGQENMSASAHALPSGRLGQKMGTMEVVDTMLVDGLTDAFAKYHMGITAENVAERFSVGRAAQDEFAAASQQKAEAAQKAGKFKDQILPVHVPTRKGEIIFDLDEYPKQGVKAEDLGKLKPAFKKDGTVTAANASGINDGAAMCLLMSQQKATELGLQPIARVLSFAAAGVDPAIMGTGPIPASRKALEKAGLQVSDLDLIESNEAFAAQSLAVSQEVGWDTSKVNVNGGAIALGHPIGASGCRVVVDLLHEMRRRGAQRGLATLCIGGGQGVAGIFELVPSSKL